MPIIYWAANGFERLEPLSPVVAHRRRSGLTCLLGFMIRRPLLLLALRLFFLLGLLQPVSLGALEVVVGFASYPAAALGGPYGLNGELSLQRRSVVWQAAPGAPVASTRYVRIT